MFSNCFFVHTSAAFLSDIGWEITKKIRFIKELEFQKNMPEQLAKERTLLEELYATQRKALPSRIRSQRMDLDISTYKKQEETANHEMTKAKETPTIT